VSGSRLAGYRLVAATPPTRPPHASRLVGLPGGYAWQFVQQRRLCLGHVRRLKVGDGSGFEVLPNGILDKCGDVASLSGRQISQLLFDASGKLDAHGVKCTPCYPQLQAQPAVPAEPAAGTDGGRWLDRCFEAVVCPPRFSGTTFGSEAAKEKDMNDSPEAIVRGLLALWGDPKAERLAEFFAEDAVWVDGPNGVHRGAKAIVEELTRQLSIFRGQWVEVDTLIADGGTVMVEWHGGFDVGGRTIHTKVMAAFEVDANGRILQMRESFDMKSLTDQFKASGFQVPGERLERAVLSGRCLCGGVRYTIARSPHRMVHCHCGNCRRSTGASFATAAVVRACDLSVLDGRDLIANFESSRGYRRYFCSRCGSPLYGASEHAPQILLLRCGTLDVDPLVRPSVHIHVGDRAAWIEISDDLEKFEGPVGAEDIRRIYFSES
jgi:limonene-1,2-epoxide hydrolase